MRNMQFSCWEKHSHWGDVLLLCVHLFSEEARERVEPFKKEWVFQLKYA